VSRDPVSARVSLQPGAAPTDRLERSAMEAAEQVATVIGPRQYETPDAAGLKTMCASADPGEAGFCSGILFNTALAPGVCAPKTADGRLDTAKVDREGKRRIAALTPAVGQGPVPFARQALRQAFPCSRQNARTIEMPVTLDWGSVPPAIRKGQVLVRLAEEKNGSERFVSVAIAPINKDVLPGQTLLYLTDDLFPGFGQPNRSYRIDAIVYEDGGRERAFEPSTLRLAPLSRGSAARLRPTLALAD